MRSGAKGRRGVVVILAAALLWAAVLPEMIYADTGPKPSVVVDFAGFEGQVCYVTLLSENMSTGPHYAVETGYGERYSKEDEEWEIYCKFLEYVDGDGFYFLQEFGDCTGGRQYVWGYYPPERFKILLYLPTEERFLTDDQVYERYAFDSYYTVTAVGEGISVIRTDRTKENLYIAAREGLLLLIRMAITIAVELGVAWLFLFRARRQGLTIALVNVVTQILLNLVLVGIYYWMGSLGVTFFYIPCELAVFVMEAFCYQYVWRLRQKDSAVSVGRIWGYSFAANLLSFGVGVGLAYLAPWLV